jgi:hypothetical protein
MCGLLPFSLPVLGLKTITFQQKKLKLLHAVQKANKYCISGCFYHKVRGFLSYLNARRPGKSKFLIKED